MPSFLLGVNASDKNLFGVTEVSIIRIPDQVLCPATPQIPDEVKVMLYTFLPPVRGTIAPLVVQVDSTSVKLPALFIVIVAGTNV